MAIVKGRNSSLQTQAQTSILAVPGTSEGAELKFITFEANDGSPYTEDKTVNTGGTLMGKGGCSDEAWTFSGTSHLDFNEIGRILFYALGAPVTTGAGPYTHTFTLDLDDRPTGLAELGFSDVNVFRRWLGFYMNQFSWGVVSDDQEVSWSGFMAQEVKTLGAGNDERPTSAWDTTTTRYATNKACKQFGQVYDILGASTIGEIRAATFDYTNDTDAQSTANGVPGYGRYVLGDISMSGTFDVIWDSVDSTLQYRENHTSIPLVLATTNADGTNSLTANLPAVELDKPTFTVDTAKGLIQTVAYKAHESGTAPTLVLINDIASYT